MDQTLLNPIVISELDIWRAANLLIRQDGENAEREAARKADSMLNRGDHDGQLVWMRIRRAIAGYRLRRPGRRIRPRFRSGNRATRARSRMPGRMQRDGMPRQFGPHWRGTAPPFDRQAWSRYLSRNTGGKTCVIRR